MRGRTTAWLAAAVLLLGAYLFVWERGDAAGGDRAARLRRALRIDAERVTALEIDCPAGRFACLRRGAAWRLAAPIAAPADASRIRQILATLQDLPRGEVILPAGRSPDAYAHYGLEPPAAAIAAMQGPATNRLLIGRRSPLGDGVYVRREGQDGVIRVPTAILDLLPATPDALRSRTLLAGVPSAVTRLEIRNDSGYIQLARTPAGAWRILQPVDTRADPVPVDTILRELFACTVVQFVQDGVTDFSPYGLDTRSALTAILDTEGGPGARMVAFGDPLASAPGLVYARLQGENSVYAVPDAAARALAVRPDDLRDRRIPGLSLPSRIRGIRAESGDSVLQLERTGNGTWQIERPRRVPADPAAIDALLAGWAAVRVMDFETPPSPSAASALPPPPEPRYTRRIQITLQGEDAPAILFAGPLDTPEGGDGASSGGPAPDACRIRIDGETATAIAAPTALLDFPLDAEPYQSLDVLSIPASNILSIDARSPLRTFTVRRDPVTGDWVRPPPDFPALLAALAPLRAAEWLPLPPADSHPFASLRITRTGSQTLSNTLLYHPDGTISLRGHPSAFRLPPDSPLAQWLNPPAPSGGIPESPNPDNPASP